MLATMATFFVAGIIQGSIAEKRIHSQDYRVFVKQLILDHVPGASVFCPFENHPNSIDYDYETGQRVFIDLMGKASQPDVLIAYAPQASMGTAIEMWEAYNANRIVLCISPLKENWVVKFLSTEVFESMDEFAEYVKSGRLGQLLRDRAHQNAQRTSGS